MKNVSSPPPLQPITATQHHLFSLNKLKQVGALNQFKRIQPYPTPAPPEAQSVVKESNDQSVLRVQIKQGSFGEFRSYAGKNLKDSPEMERKIIKDRSPVTIAKETLAKSKDTETMLPVNEFPNLITIHGLTTQRASTETERNEMENAKMVFQEFPMFPVSPPPPPHSVSVSVQEPIIVPSVIVETPKEDLPVLDTSKSPITDVPKSPACEIPNPQSTPLKETQSEVPVEKPKAPTTEELVPPAQHTEKSDMKKVEPPKNYETVDKPLDKVTEETDSNKSEEDYFPLKRRQFKRPSILGGRKKITESSPILASTLKRAANAAAKKCEKVEDKPADIVANKPAVVTNKPADVVADTPAVVVANKEDFEIKEDNKEIEENKVISQSILNDIKPPNIEDKVAEDFDPTKVLDWQDGVGVLPGSNLKVNYLF